jgi:hypothetical protein
MKQILQLQNNYLSTMGFCVALRFGVLDARVVLNDFFDVLLSPMLKQE